LHPTAPQAEDALDFWNLADAFDLIAELRAEHDALIQGERRLSWREVERRARNLGAWMLENGASHQGKVAIYTYNHPAYMETVYAAMKAALVAVNVNYRYRADELRYLLENSDAEFAVVHEDFVPLLAEVRPDLPKLRGVLVVGDESLAGAESYEAVAEADREAPAAPRSGDDLLFLYTGGTTGLPKGVMWRQHDLYDRLGGGGIGPSPPDREALRTFITSLQAPLRMVVGPPLMHGTGWLTATIGWLAGGALLLLDNPKKFDPADLWRCVERHRATAISIVGDSFASPMLRELRGGPGYDISSVGMIVSSGVIWSEETKRGLLEFNPNLGLVDAFSSSEALGMGTSVTTSQGVSRTARFQLSNVTRLFDEALQPIETRPGARGLVGVAGPQPIGYYKDPEKTAQTFVEVGDQRFSVPGDWAVVNDDGLTLTLLGRGSVCINTGGEKVFPEEVEEVLKLHPTVKDAVVVGVPDEKWGEAITAVVSSAGSELDPAGLVSFVKQRLAGYKAPKHVVAVDEVYRSPSGKADFRRTRQAALEALGLAG
jgi:fatty-acyl-CoA synthase